MNCFGDQADKVHHPFFLFSGKKRKGMALIRKGPNRSTPIFSNVTDATVLFSLCAADITHILMQVLID